MIKTMIYRYTRMSYGYAHMSYGYIRSVPSMTDDMEKQIDASFLSGDNGWIPQIPDSVELSAMAHNIDWLIPTLSGYSNLSIVWFE